MKQSIWIIFVLLVLGFSCFQLGKQVGSDMGYKEIGHQCVCENEDDEDQKKAQIGQED